MLQVGEEMLPIASGVGHIPPRATGRWQVGAMSPMHQTPSAEAGVDLTARLTFAGSFRDAEITAVVELQAVRASTHNAPEQSCPA